MQPIPADNASIAQAAELLRQGCLVAFPTETVYGLGADASNPEAVARIFTAKGRPANHPLIIHIASVEQLSSWAIMIPDTAYRLAEHFWPGPLAMVLNKQAHVPLAVTGGQNTVGIRVPQHPVALALLRAFNGGIAAPSANRFCRISPTQASHVAEELGDAVDLILDGGPCEVGVESTIVALTDAQPRLLRPGQITVEAIEAVLGTRLILPTNIAETADIRAPGMLALHYAPTTPAKLCKTEMLPETIQAIENQRKHCALLHFSAQQNMATVKQAIQLPENADAYAQQLYAALRTLDNCHLDLILIEQPPTTSPWRAVNDRLKKATA